jgi:protocatechuate 3,4-dioxygenase beta subunit
MQFAARSAPVRAFALGAVLTCAAGIAHAADPVTLAPRGEPGEPFEVTGVVYENDGKTPAAGVRVLVYHTDATGHYSKGGQDREHARLSGTAVTGRDGAYRFRTIWPGPYPGGGVPRHVHYELTAADGRRMSAELEFSNDPMLAAREREAAQAAAKRGDRFHSVQAAAKGKDGVRRSTFDLRLPARSGRAS